jgi:hypothetical protein
MPCGDSEINSCLTCVHYAKKQELCTLGFDISEILLHECYSV